MKRCPNCNEVKFLIEFSKDKTRPDGLNRICRLCKSKTDSGRIYKHSKKAIENKYNHKLKTMPDSYIKSILKQKGLPILHELIQIQRLLIILKRNINELQRDNRPTSGC